MSTCRAPGQGPSTKQGAADTPRRSTEPRRRYPASQRAAYLTELSRPRVSSIMKKMSAQKMEPGMVEMAAGYTMNTSPGPSVATSWMFRPDTSAM